MSNSVGYILLLVVASILVVACQSTPEKVEQENLGWISLFNGKDLSGWTPKFRGYPVGENYKNTFRVEDGLLTVSYDNWENFDNNSFGHLFTDQSYSNYRLRIEYRFIGKQVTNSPKFTWAYRNNGVMLHSPAAEYMELDQPFPMSAEAQLLGGNGIDERTSGNLCSPTTNIVQNGELITKHCVNSNSKTYHGDQWVWFEAEVSSDGPIKHYINGELVFEYEELQVDPNDPLGKKWLDEGNPLKLTKGHFSLQAETHPIQFRRIEIKPLD